MHPTFRPWQAASLLLSFGLTTALTSGAQAATVVYSQAPAGNARYLSGILNAAADPGFNWTSDADTEAWAYFSVHSPARFNRISWYGSNTDGAFGVDLFLAVSTPTTTCFSCGANPVGGAGDFSNNLLPSTGPYSQAQVHKTLVVGDLYAYNIDLGSPVTLASNKLYGLSVVNNYSSSPFLWAASAQGIGRHLTYTIGQAMFLPSPQDLAFSLTDTQAPAVPEPQTWAMLAAGLALLVHLSRRTAQAGRS